MIRKLALVVGCLGRASLGVAQLWRVFDGHIQGFHMLQKIGPAGSTSPWVAVAAAH